MYNKISKILQYLSNIRGSASLFFVALGKKVLTNCMIDKVKEYTNYIPDLPLFPERFSRIAVHFFFLLSNHSSY